MKVLTRIDKSRRLIKTALDSAYGSYIEQEGKKTDQWRDQNIGQLGAHIRHEIDECMDNIKRGEMGYLMHNAMDVMELGAMLFIKAQELTKDTSQQEK